MDGPVAASVSHIRHFVHYHDSEVLGINFAKVASWSVLANKRVRDLAGDFVWMIGREAATAEHYLFGRFRVDSDAPGNHDQFKYRISGRTGLWLKPAVPLSDLPWFSRLQQKPAGGFVAVTDEEVLDGLRHVVHPPVAAVA